MTTSDFGQAVRAWRDRVPPESAGLPAAGHRRAAGLRREELALLSGISVDYVTRLEQGRATAPSAQVVEALARALRLSGPERAHLFRLAGLAPPGRGLIPSHLTPSIQRLLDRLAGTPVAVSDLLWNLITWNAPWVALMGEPGSERNIIRRHFLLQDDGRIIRTRPEMEAYETEMVGDLRTAVGRYPDDPRGERMIADLRAGSERFAELWNSGVLGVHTSFRKTIGHPAVGPVELDCDVLDAAGTDLRLIAYTAEPGSEAAEKLALITVLGTQTLTS
ncbi:helix-turn-helix transcriptional regulator [Actinoplanes sp. NBRC 103695]|uniref:helix-turn-helix transcriptional regulator n=1 Tax=Actinoplanes sp. NBRC 103695 TaxID=3032202 RepID=UPI0024A337EC|nr:helix-turn-helix transcriptional regulator [Actinoplanes sp. NBRC 103695]GLY96120.1 transcriptional regulator [Actinoplanes sp. NBRC 103695]